MWSIVLLSICLALLVLALVAACLVRRPEDNAIVVLAEGAQDIGTSKVDCSSHHVQAIPVDLRKLAAIDGTLRQEDEVVYGPVYMSSGSVVRIDLNWLPRETTVEVGIILARSCLYRYDRFAGGTARVEVRHTLRDVSELFAVIRNLSFRTVTYRGYIRTFDRLSRDVNIQCTSTY